MMIVVELNLCSRCLLSAARLYLFVEGGRFTFSKFNSGRKCFQDSKILWVLNIFQRSMLFCLRFTGWALKILLYITYLGLIRTQVRGVYWGGFTDNWRCIIESLLKFRSLVEWLTVSKVGRMSMWADFRSIWILNQLQDIEWIIII